MQNDVAYNLLFIKKKCNECNLFTMRNKDIFTPKDLRRKPYENIYATALDNYV